MIGLATDPLDEIAVIGAHCDDIAIGMGGTLLSICSSRPGLRVRALVLSGAGTDREVEERRALAAFCPGAALRLTVADVPDGLAPSQWGRVKDLLRRFRDETDAQVVFGPHRHDAHQDHRLVAELLPTEFRDNFVLGYEILKWESDTPQPSVFQLLDDTVAAEKARLLDEHYISQRSHDWFDQESFLALSRLRGIQCRHTHAEGFMMEKAIIRFGGS